MSVHAFEAVNAEGQDIRLEQYKGRVLLIVNTASQCGLTPQYEGLQQLFQTYADEGFAVLGFPCNQFGGQEPGTDEEIKDFCTLNYRVTFPMFRKVEVNGPEAHPLFRYLREQAPEDADADPNSGLYGHLRAKFPELLEGSNIRWNFTKFLIDREGNVVKRYSPTTGAGAIETDVRTLLSKTTS
ncbi:glutathione peroxidase [Paenibacillus antri]|uniref:Glutathione peroxidase n=1 Tax=Paenibacillus antri TaxID=2582848 RepID=A0A5R9GH48_9BACL|nr:glutathione peroxidase [Paenibacillus antri]TLS52728.1 glutathione peroxidase [Paenibacillus antri]